MSLRRIFTLLSLVLFAGLFVTACKPDFPNCDKDEHCADSTEGQEAGRLYCVNGLCQQCRSDVDCGGDGMECVAGACEQIPGYCTSATDCPGNQSCRDNRCGPECIEEGDCASGFTCEGGSCVAEPECSDDADCGVDQVCRRGECQAKPEPVACQLSSVYFSYDSSQLDSEARAVLQENADCIKERNLRVRVEGHCDERGTAEYNLALGERRANSVVNYLTSMGVSRSQLSTTSYGDQQRVRNCGEQGAESCHRMNRRAEFSIR